MQNHVRQDIRTYLYLFTELSQAGLYVKFL